VLVSVLLFVPVAATFAVIWMGAHGAKPCTKYGANWKTIFSTEW